MNIINVFELRFNILYQFYENLMMDEELFKISSLFKILKDYPKRLIISNTQYLLFYKYIDFTSNDQNTMSITLKGIKFIEIITKGDIPFNFTWEDEKICKETFSALNNDEQYSSVLRSNSEEIKQ